MNKKLIKKILLSVGLSFLVLTILESSNFPVKNKGFDPGPVFIMK